MMTSSDIDLLSLGFFLGCLFTYLSLVRPLSRLHGEYVERLEKRLRDRRL